ncbi:HAAS signaling domain-containing protein [Actinoplanes sp. URMC 104]|uniref:HAAS signaling domain-containing protein n=1 Tax=Actinoplanes sp. URMC 104 TaxID=3423409 RepID=UPI003F1D20F2
MNSTAQDEITEYVERVRAALADLPEATRDELLEDLPEHLAEIRAEDTVTLTDRLGTPEAYAAELRATAAAYIGSFPEPPKRRFEPFHQMRADVLRVLGTADVRIGPVIGYAKASDFLVLLRPAWWVLRGYLAAMVLAYAFTDNSSGLGLLPRLGGSTVVALVLLTGCVIASILLGRRAPQLSVWPKRFFHGATVALVLFALIGFTTTDSDARDPFYDNVGYSGNAVLDDNVQDVQDVFVYDSHGRLVPDARLFDQSGAPIQLGQPQCSDLVTGEVSYSRHTGYPFCPDSAPFPTAEAIADPAPSTPPAPSSPAPVATSPSPAAKATPPRPAPTTSPAR